MKPIVHVLVEDRNQKNYRINVILEAIKEQYQGELEFCLEETADFSATIADDENTHIAIGIDEFGFEKLSEAKASIPQLKTIWHGLTYNPISEEYNAPDVVIVPEGELSEAQQDKLNAAGSKVVYSSGYLHSITSKLISETLQDKDVAEYVHDLGERTQNVNVVMLPGFIVDSDGVKHVLTDEMARKEAEVIYQELKESESLDDSSLLLVSTARTDAYRLNDEGQVKETQLHHVTEEVGYAFDATTMVMHDRFQELLQNDGLRDSCSIEPIPFFEANDEDELSSDGYPVIAAYFSKHLNGGTIFIPSDDPEKLQDASYFINKANVVIYRPFSEFDNDDVLSQLYNRGGVSILGDDNDERLVSLPLKGAPEALTQIVNNALEMMGHGASKANLHEMDEGISPVSHDNSQLLAITNGQEEPSPSNLQLALIEGDSKPKAEDSNPWIGRMNDWAQGASDAIKPHLTSRNAAIVGGVAAFTGLMFLASKTKLGEEVVDKVSHTFGLNQ